MDLFEFANERESIRLLREAGVSAPWTKDERLNRLHFGNIFREDDPTTQWIHKHMVSWSPDNPADVLFSACVSRMFGTVEALVQVIHMDDVDEIFDTLERTHPKRWRFTGRYEVKPPRGSTRMAVVKEALLMVQGSPGHFAYHRSQEDMHEALCHLPGVGPMLANEIIADLHGTSVFPFGHGAEYVFPHWGVMAGLGMKPKRLFPLTHSHPKVLEASAALDDILEQSRTEWRHPDRPWTLTTAARAALLYGQYLNEDYSRKRSR